MKIRSMHKQAHVESHDPEGSQVELLRRGRSSGEELAIYNTSYGYIACVAP
jgi:hypothetical protein